MIRVPSQANAKSMLLKVATPLGCEGDTRYYILDGKAWKIGANGQVYRSDDSAETAKLVRKFKPIRAAWIVRQLNQIEQFNAKQQAYWPRWRMCGRR